MLEYDDDDFEDDLQKRGNHYRKSVSTLQYRRSASTLTSQ